MRRGHHFPFGISFSIAAALLLFLHGPAGAEAPDRTISQQIDLLVEKTLKRQGLEPNPPAGDEVFLRRLYLSIAGRIPTAEEARSFLDSSAPNKRSARIDQLLGSPAHVSRQFNFWADLLRLKSDIQAGAGEAYSDWLKEAIRSNKPYDQFVRELVTSKGYVWDNGAVGYYMRDSGMPLDNMSNTAQIFLGTRLVCAQCHNHPFDKWTQMDYYQLAAYTYGVETRVNPESIVGIDKLEERRKRRRSYDGMDAHLRQAVSDVLEPLGYAVRDTERELHLPDDYQYKDAHAGEAVRADTPFGRGARSNRDPRDAYARWMTAPENPRFTQVIANRLWKQVMGMGLIEPVDDLKDDTAASNPELMEYLTRQMTQMGYDTKRFLRVLYQTRTFQREATRDEVLPDQPYHFQGPLLRRLTAEQLWDSVVTAIVPAVDERLGSSDYRTRQEQMKQEAQRLIEMKPKEILEKAEPIAQVEREYAEKAKGIRAQLLAARESGDSSGANRLQKELDQADQTRREAIQALKNQESQQTMMAGNTAMMQSEKPAQGAGPDPGRWKDYPADFLRASELRSPAPSDHFLQQFGQSDRETIDAAHQDPSVAQVLTLLNGPTFQQLTAPNSVLSQACAAAQTDEEREDALFLSLLSRRPSEEERQLVRQEAQRLGSFDNARPSLAWALINTREFSFVQ